MADDVVQETWRIALEDPPRGLRSLQAWLRIVVRNVAQHARRTERRRKTRETRAAVTDTAPSAAEVTERAELHRRVVEAVLALDDPYRSTILFRYFEDTTPQEIARREGIPAATVRTRLRRGLARVRERLDDAHAGNRAAWLAGASALVAPPMGATPSAGLALGLAGGLLMKLKIGLAVLVAVILLAGAYVVTRDFGPNSPPSEERPAAAFADEPSPATSEEEYATSGQEDGESPALPPPVDLEAADRDLDLFGRVVDESGEPIAGAFVEALRYPWRRISVLDLELMEKAEPGPTTRTASDGTFSIRRAICPSILHY